MTEEKRSEGGGNKDKSGKRRYFRRRNKSKKPDAGPEQKQSEGAPAKSTPRGASAQDRKGPPPNKKRRSRRRRSTRRGNQPMDSSPAVSRDTEPTYEEPISVFVYTHVIRPAYRDVVSDYRPESSFLEEGEHESSVFDATALLTPEIREQIAQQFRIGDEPPLEKPAVKVSSEGWSDEGWDDDDDWKDDWDDDEST